MKSSHIKCKHKLLRKENDNKASNQLKSKLHYITLTSYYIVKDIFK